MVRLKDMDLIIRPFINRIEFVYFNPNKRKVLFKRTFRHNAEGGLTGFRKFQIISLGRMNSFVVYKEMKWAFVFPIEQGGPMIKWDFTESGVSKQMESQGKKLKIRVTDCNILMFPVVPQATSDDISKFYLMNSVVLNEVVEVFDKKLKLFFVKEENSADLMVFNFDTR